MAQTLKERAREAAARLAKSSRSAGRAALLRARSAGRGLSTAASKSRESFCARTAPPPSPEVVKARLDRAMRAAAPRLGYTADDLAIRSEDDAAGVAGMFASKAKSDRLAKAVHLAALHWSWWLMNKDTNDLRDAYDYAANVLDEVS
jgi:hypothetical protein